MSNKVNKIITSFGSAFIEITDPLYSEIEEIGKICAQKGYKICSGGFFGSMEAISKGARSANGKTIGINVKGWNKNPNDFLDEIILADNLMERIMKLIHLGNAYIIFRGGTGTLLEISAVLELMNKGSIAEKPVIFYTHFWKNVTDLLKLDSPALKNLIENNIHFINSPAEINTLI